MAVGEADFAEEVAPIRHEEFLRHQLPSRGRYYDWPLVDHPGIPVLTLPPLRLRPRP